MKNLIQVLFSSIKAKIVPIWTKIKYWTSKTFWQSKVLTGLRKAFAKLFDIRPRHKKDYFSFGRWLVSRRLCFAVVIALGVVSLCFLLLVVNPFAMFQTDTDGIRSYRYNSIPLRFVEGEVKIKADSGYVAYVGSVKDGYAEGAGTLYNSQGDLVYNGNFGKSKYNGNGTLFYPEGQTKYSGEFADNLFEGSGILYRTNGSQEYSGDFVAGQKEGTGVQFDSGNNPVFTGLFHTDEIAYSQFLGKKTSELGEMYTGSSVIYSYSDEIAVSMSDIDCLYVLDNRKNSIEEDAVIEKIYVLSDDYIFGQKKLTSMDEVTEVLGTPQYKGNSYIKFPEAIAIDLLTQEGKLEGIDAGVEKSAVFDEMRTVESYDYGAEIYLYSYIVDDVTYTFFCKDKTSSFFMYMMQM